MADLNAVHFVSRSHRGKVKRNNQDCLSINSELVCAAIADGIGGNAFGEVASQLSIDACMEYLTTEQNSVLAKPTKELSNAIKVANEEIITIQQNEPKYKNMGSTLSCFNIIKEELDYAWVGDSRIYLIRPSEESITMLTNDHTLDQSKIDPTLSPQLYKRAPSILTRTVGSILLLKPDVGSVQLETSDIVLACTDGLSNLVADELILEYTLKADTNYSDGLEKLADKLLDRALDCGGQDNISFILAKIN